MTRNDFEIVASVLADVETTLENIYGGDPSAAEDYKLAMLVHKLTMERLSIRFKQANPRFDSGKFEMHAAPIRSAALKASILAKLAEGV